jgi:hypothetical protein
MFVRAIILVSLFAFSSLGFAYQGGPEDPRESDSGVTSPPYEKILAMIQDLAHRFPNTATAVQYGKTPKGVPLALIKVERKLPPESTPPLRPAIVISGSTHGDEYLNIEDRLPQYFLENQDRAPGFSGFINRGGIVYFVPILNPDGLRARTRGNSKGTDLNRDFTVKAANYTGFKEVETRSLAQYLDQDLKTSGARLRVTMDYHCCIGALLYPWSFDRAPVVPAGDRKAAQAIGSTVSRLFGAGFKVGTTPDTLGYSAVGTTKDFYYEAYGATAFTFEGEYRIEPQNFSKHIEMWEAIFSMSNAQLIR